MNKPDLTAQDNTSDGQGGNTALPELKSLSVVAGYLQLGKPQITIPVSLSALTGFLLFKGSYGTELLYTLAGVFLMSFASSAINHVQDAGIDSLMERTRHRPVPSGRITPRAALITAGITAIAGFLLLLWGTVPSAAAGSTKSVFTGLASEARLMPAMLSLFTMACYNLMYTPLKRITAFAAIPGALIGALPPAIGWTAAGGNPLHLHIIIVGFFFFTGQIPHFWLILLKHSRDYEKAGLPNLSKLFSQRQIMNMTIAWVAATAMSAVLLPVMGVIGSTVISASVLLMSLALLISFSSWLKKDSTPSPARAFNVINLFYLAMMLALIIDAVAS